MTQLSTVSHREPNAQTLPVAPRMREPGRLLCTHLLVDRELNVLGHDAFSDGVLGTPGSELRIVRDRLVADNHQWQAGLGALLSDDVTRSGRVLATTSPRGTLRVEVRAFTRGGEDPSPPRIRLVTVKNNTIELEVHEVACSFGLSARETEILHAICGGLKIKEFAARTKIATETARKELKSMLKKLGVGYQIDAVRLVYQTYVEERVAA